MDTSEENSIKVSGIVKSLSHAGVHDLVFELENNAPSYYINRGMEHRFNLEKAKKE